MNKIEVEEIAQQVEQEILQELITRSNDFEYVEQKVTMKDKNSVYRLSSALQKSIRRGYVELSQRYAQAIYNGGGQDYLWRRLPVIALEDIGLVNIALCSEVLHFTRFSSVRKQLDEKKALVMLVTRLAQSLKSRLLCEAMCSVEFSPIFKDKNLSEAEEAYPENSLRGTRLQVWKSMKMWGWGAQEKDQTTTDEIEKMAAEKEQLKQLEEVLKYSNRHFYTLLASSKKSVYHLHAPMLPLLEHGYLSGPTLRIKEMKFGEPEMLSGVPDFSYDQHTSKGQSAIAYVMKSSKVLKEFQKNNLVELKFDHVSKAIFQSESQLLDRELTDDKAAGLKDFSDLEVEWASVGLSAKMGAALVDVCRQEEFRKELLHARKRVLDLTPSQSHH